MTSPPGSPRRGLLSWSDPQIDRLSRKEIRELVRELRDRQRELELKNEELRRTRKELEDLSRFPEDNPHPVLRVKRDGKILYLNPAAEMIFGSPRGRPLPEKMSALVRRAARTGKISSDEVEEQDRVYYVSAVPDPGRNYVNIYGLDVTGQVAIGKVLDRERKLLKSVMRTTDVMLVFLDREFNFVWVNQAYARTCRMTPREMIGKNHFALYSDPENEAIFRRVRDTGRKVFYKDKPFVFPDQPERGTTYWDWSLSPVKDRSGRVVSLVFSLRETTKYQRARLALAESEERYRLLFDHMIEGFALHEIILDKAGRPRDYRFLEVNRAFEKLTGVSRKRLIGRTVREVLPETETYWIEQFGKVALTGRPLHYENYSSALGKWYETFAYSTGNNRFAVVFNDITNRKLSEGALRHREELLRKAQQMAHLGSWELDLVTKKLSWSDETYRIFGLQHGEFQASYEAFLQRVHPEDRQEVDAAYSGSIREGKNSYEIEHRVIRKNTGEVRIVHEKCTHTRDSSGKVIRSVGMVHDITKRKLAEKALKQERQKLRAILDSIDDLIYITGTDCEVEYINPAMKKVFGPIGGKKCHNYLHGREKPCPECRQEEVMGGKIVRYEWEAPQAGKIYDIIESPVPNPDGTISKLKIMRDITELKKLEQSLRQLNEKLEETVIRRTVDLNDVKEILEKIFASVHFQLAYLEADFNFLRVNRAYAETYGRKPGYFIGRNYFDLFPSPENERIFRRVAETGRAFVTYARPFVSSGKSGKRTTYRDWSLRPVKDEKGAVDGFLLILVDVTEEKQSQEKLTRAQKKMADMQRLADLGTLASMVAHEMRNPLATVRLAADNLARKTGDPNLTRHIRLIASKIEVANQIITNLLDYSRLSVPQYRTFSIIPLIRECVAVSRKAHSRKKVSIRTELGPLARKRISADRDQFRQVLNNILDNALDFCPEEDGRLEIIGRIEKGNQLVLRFRDNGPGFSEEGLREAFTPFYTGKASGTGLGLAISRDLVNLHNGSIEAENAAGGGALITLKLPLRDPHI